MGRVFDRTGSKYAFRILRFINPLYHTAESFHCANEIRTPAWQVWHPQFESLLFDLLAEDVFDSVGGITTLDDLAREVEGVNGYENLRVIALAFSRQIERARGLIDQTERSYPGEVRWQNWARSQRAFLEQDIGSACATIRANGAMAHLRAILSEDREQLNVIKMKSIDINVRCSPPASLLAKPSRGLWLAHNDFTRGTKDIHDYRAGPVHYASRPMTGSDLPLCEFAEPRFGDFGEFWQRICTYLGNEGFGSFA